MPATLEKAGAETATPRSVFIPRFLSTVVLWSIALAIAFSGYEIFFWLLISAFGLVALLMFARLLHDEPLQTMAYTLLGLLYVLWLFNFTTKILYLTPRSGTGIVT